ncbi:carbohydrate sulfotransferase 11-like [Mercenaria mercenaria]|uniref:carbohydrate sulfotransferase 11-like n=1 Tax=Mercenaria mercenaria TaxID=6596 RepID=UPI00234E5A3C|nr:carbohydrate sulfotransferase 11-like [Mercenaria mercenaria]
MREYVTSVNSVIKDNSMTIIVSRDPYSRLFSAYIDKSFLQLMLSLNYYIRNIAIDELYKSNVCLTDVTFQEFSEWIVKESQSGKTLDRYWALIFSLCYPCAINPFILVKQETFARGVEFALLQLGVERSTSVKPETLRRVRDLYKQDFEMFGYSKLPPTAILTRQT